MNYHDQTNQQFNQWNGNQQILETQMGSLSGNPYLINNPNGGMKSDQQLNMGMNGMNMMGGMNGMNMQIPGGAIFPGIGMAAAIPADPRRFVYSGDEITYKVRFDQLQQSQIQPITEAVIFINGKQSSQMNTLGLCCTIVWGAFLILPLIMMCFDCWKRCIYPNFELSQQFYSSLGRLVRGNLQSLVLLVKDNSFGEKKAKILYQVLSSHQSLLGFTFINYAQGYNYNQSQYSNFEQNMKPIKKLPIMTDLRWFRQVVTV